MALGCAKGLLHDWIWVDNGLQECGGTLWRNTPILFSPWLTIKRLQERRRQEADNRVTAAICEPGWDGSRSWRGVCQSAGICACVAEAEQNSLKWELTDIFEVPNSWLIEKHLSQWLHSDCSVFSIYGRSQCHRKGEFGPRFTVLIQAAAEQHSDIRIRVCVPVSPGCVLFFSSVWWLSVWPKTPGCLSGEIRAGMEKSEFARHLLSFTSDLNYVLAAAGVQSRETTSVCHVIFYTADTISFSFPLENIYSTLKSDTHTVNWVEMCFPVLTFWGKILKSV